MRFPVLDGDDGKIDEAAAMALVDEAMAGGINYYDTAWGYHGGSSELVLARPWPDTPGRSFSSRTSSRL